MKVIEKINLIWALVVTVLSGILGTYWYLFAAFLALNVLDYITGVIKARRYKKENSNKGLDGIIKKFGYWVVIAISFFLSRAFIGLGKDIGVDLGFTMFLGWFVLTTFLINEVRSILENLVLMGVWVPEWLTRGLKVAADKINGAAGGDSDEHN